MRDIKLTEPIAVTLKAAEWYWLLGLLNCAANQGAHPTLDELYRQLMDAVA